MKLTYKIKFFLPILIAFGFVISDWIISDGKLSWGGIFFVFCLGVLVLEPFIAKRIKKNAELLKEYVEFDDSEIRRVIPSHLEEKIAWTEIAEIAIATNDQGPFFDDLFWMLMNKDKSKGILLSNDVKGFRGLLSELQKLPNFNNEEVIKAMGCTENKLFHVWKLD